MNPCSRRLLVICGVLLLASCSYGSVSYQGSLAGDFSSTDIYNADGLLNGIGAWVHDPGNDSQWRPARLEWDVTQDDVTSPWHYHYKLSIYKGALSHFILETSDTFTGNGNQLTSVSTSPAHGTNLVNTYYPPGEGPGGSAQPGMPDPIYGIKFDSFSEPSGDSKIKTAEIWFTSDRAPIWGDFYAKDGTWGATWNAGLTDNDVDPDILIYPVSSGSVQHHLLVPDTFSGEPHEDPDVPEPTTLTFVGLVVGGLILKRRRR